MENKETIQLLLEKLAIESNKKSELIEDIIGVCETQQKMLERTAESIRLLNNIVSANGIALTNAEKDFRNGIKLIDNLQDQIDTLAGGNKNEL